MTKHDKQSIHEIYIFHILLVSISVSWKVFWNLLYCSSKALPWMWNYWHCSYENQRITELVFGKYILGTQFNQKAMVLLQSLLFLHLDMIRQKYFNSPTNVHVT